MTRRVFGFAAILFFSGCAEEELDGRYFNVSINGETNGCTAGTMFKEDFEYRLELDTDGARISIGPTLFAEGTLDGCGLVYSSPVFTEFREVDDGSLLEVRFRIEGDATVDSSGGDSCVQDGSDWEGTETFVVVNSEHPDVAPGCTYETSVTGKFVRIVGEEDSGPGAPQDNEQ